MGYLPISKKLEIARKIEGNRTLLSTVISEMDLEISEHDLENQMFMMGYDICDNCGCWVLDNDKNEEKGTCRYCDW